MMNQNKSTVQFSDYLRICFVTINKSLSGTNSEVSLGVAVFEALGDP